MNVVKSKIIPLPRKDIDTDLIIPADFLKVTDQKGLGQHVFARLRAEDKNFPFNLEKYQGAQILVTRENFGCGSSREHAAWALSDWGIKVIIAPSFSDIFYSNSRQNFILPVILQTEFVEQILSKAAQSSYEIVVDLPRQRIVLPDKKELIFEIDPYMKKCLEDGIDDMEYLLGNLNEIREFAKSRDTSIFFNLKNL